MSDAGYMTIPEAQRWLNDLAAFGRKWGAAPAINKIAAYLRRKHVERARAHVSPGGQSWSEHYWAPAPKIGDKAPMLLDDTGGRRVVTEIIRSGRGAKRARDFRRRYGPPMRGGVPALIRTRAYPGARKTRIILDALQSPSRLVRTTRTSLTYGWTPGTRWIEDLHFGGASRKYRGKKIPPRPIIGMDSADVAFALKAFADLVARYAGTGRET